MKMNFKKIPVGMLGILLIFSFLVPTLSMARNDNPGLNNSNKDAGIKNAGAQQAFCLRIESWAEKTGQNIVKNQERIANRQEERLQNIEEKRIQRENRLMNFREEWEQNRERQYEQLEQMAQTDAQKQALLEFKQTIETAMVARKNAMNTAISAFRTGLDQSINNRKTATENTQNAYRNAYQVAVQKAKDDCVAGVDANQVRTTFMATLRAGKDKYSSDRQEIEKNNSRTLVETRQTAIRKALDDFKTTMQTAKDKLRTAFPEKTE